MNNHLTDWFAFTGAKGLLLDLDNTVYAYQPAHEAALKACESEYMNHGFQTAFKDAYLHARNTVHHRLDGQAGMHARLLYFQQLFEDVSGSTRFDLSLKFEELYWQTFMSHMHPDEKVIQLIDFCNNGGIPVCIVTDLTAQIQHRKILKLNLQNQIKFMVSSEESGIEKPAAAIFRLALGKLQMSAEEVAMLGDSQSKDIAGAESLGIKSLLYKAC